MWRRDDEKKTKSRDDRWGGPGQVSESKGNKDVVVGTTYRQYTRGDAANLEDLLNDFTSGKCDTKGLKNNLEVYVRNGIDGEHLMRAMYAKLDEEDCQHFQSVINKAMQKKWEDNPPLSSSVNSSSSVHWRSPNYGKQEKPSDNPGASSSWLFR